MATRTKLPLADLFAGAHIRSSVSRMAARQPPFRPLILLFFSTLLGLGLGGCRRQADSSIKGGNLRPSGQPSGQRGAVAPARRIVSLTPSLTEIVFALGAGARVVGISDYCDYPPEARTRPGPRLRGPWTSW